MISLSSYASLNMEHLPPHDTINATVKTADGVHGLVEMTFGAPVQSRSQEANNGISFTGSDGWIWIKNTTAVIDGTQTSVCRITIKKVERNEKGEDVGETEEVVEIPTCGVVTEWKSFFAALGGQDDGFGSPEGALKDVAWIQAGLTSNGNPVDLVKLVQQ